MAKNGSDKAAGVTVSISAHPRAKAGIRRARTRAALIAFAVVLALNLMGDQPLFDAVWRALLAGIVVNVVVWRFAIVIWRHIVIAEVRRLEEAHAEKVKAQREERERIAAEQRARAL
jgi:signal transduction histidine kinase